MLYDLSGIWDLKTIFHETKGISLTYFTFSFFFLFFFFLFHECPSDINYKTKKKGRLAADKIWSGLMIVVQFKANGLFKTLKATYNRHIAFI